MPPINTNIGLTSDISTINSVAGFINTQGAGMIAPEVFYSKQLLDTISIPPAEYVYHMLATEMPIGDRADKLVLRRWSPLEAHTVPLMEGIPPQSDKASLEKYEIGTNQYGRYMEFTDKINFQAIDPIVSMYTRQYSEVAIKTLDQLARESLFAVAQRFYAGNAANFEALTVDSVATIADLRLIVLTLQRSLVQPSNGQNFNLIAPPEFYHDMWDDPTIQQYMRYNRTTSPMSNNASQELPDMFGLHFQKSLVAPTSADFVKGGIPAKRMYRKNGTDAAGNGVYQYLTWLETEVDGSGNPMVSVVSGHRKDSRTGQDASFIPQQKIWDIDAFNAKHGADAPNPVAPNPDVSEWYEFKAAHILITGKDALIRTSLQGEGQVRMYVKPLGSSGVIDPVDQRQSLGFKINSVGYGSSRLEAVIDYIAVPSSINPV